MTLTNDHAAVAAMVTWGRHAAGRRFHRRGAHHPPQPSFTTNAALGDLWTMQPSPGGLTQDSGAPAVTVALPGSYGVFFL